MVRGNAVTDLKYRTVTEATHLPRTPSRGRANYTVQVTNSTTGCVNTKTVTVADNKQSPVLTLTSTANTGCTLAFDGTASQSTLTDANAVGGDTYLYAWSTGATMGSIIGGATTSSIGNKNGGCTRPRTRTTERNAWAPRLRWPLTTQGSSEHHHLHHRARTAREDRNNGATSANVGGVTAGFAFQWSAATRSPIAGPNGNGGNTFATNAIAGGANYTVQVTNSTTGCVNTKTVTVADNKQNPVLTLTSTANTGCTLAFDGTASQSTLTDANAIGGDTYVYVWSAGAVIGADIGTGTGTITNERTGPVNTRPRPRTTGPSAWARPLRLPLPILRYFQQSPHRQPEHELRGRYRTTQPMSANVGGVTAGFAFQWFAGNAVTDPGPQR